MEGLGSLLLFAIFFFLMMRYGCGAHVMHGHKAQHTESSPHIDPVCNKAVAKEQGYGKMYRGSLYRFCSRDCLDKFDADPQTYSLEKEVQNHVV